MGCIGLREKIKNYLERIERLKKLAQDTTDPYGFVSINAIASLEYLRDNIPKKWRRTVVKFLQWWRERKEKSTR